MSLHVNNHAAFGHMGMAPERVYRSNAGLGNTDFALGTGMTSLYAVEDLAQPAAAAGDAGSPFVMGDLNVASCPSGTVPISEVTTCQAAATYFQKTFDGPDTKTNRPPGCYIAGDMRGLNLNQDLNGVPDPSARPVCQATLQEATLPAPSAPAQSLPAPAAAPAPAPYPSNQGGCGGCTCPQPPCPGCGCGGQSLTTLIPVPLVPVLPGGTTVMPAVGAGGVPLAPPEAAAAPPVVTTGAPEAAAPETTPAAAVATTAAPVVVEPAAEAAGNGTAPEAAPAEAAVVTTAAPAEVAAVTTAAPADAAAAGAAVATATTAAPAEVAGAVVTTLAATAAVDAGTTAAPNASFAEEEPPLILESVPINGLNSWEGSSHHPSSLLDIVFGA